MELRRRLGNAVLAALATMTVAAATLATMAVVVAPGATAVAATAIATPRYQPAATPRRQPAARAEAATIEVASLASPTARTTCLDHVSRASGPLAVIVGASFTAGVGAANPTRAWSVDFARWLGWRALVVGDPGVGYVRPGGDHLGPLWRLLALVGLSRLEPSLVVVQAGHDDHGVPTSFEEERVSGLYAKLSTELPDARLAAITVFARAGVPTRTEELTDRAIVAGIERADPAVVVMDPLQEHWRFDRSHLDGLHPSTTGATQITYLVERDLEDRGVWRDQNGAPRPICELVVRGPRPAGGGAQYLIRGST